MTDEIEVVKIDFEDSLRRMNGFDEIAVQQKFLVRPAKLEDTAAARAVLFVALRKEPHRLSDDAAFRYVMNLGLADLEAWFEIPDTTGIVSESEQAERDREYGQFVVVTGLAFTPEQYLGLTAGQKQAIYDEIAERRR